jgi:hypothetical protein
VVHRRRLFHFFGVARMLQAFVPGMRERMEALGIRSKATPTSTNIEAS